jgi:hypothetical protein
MAIKKGHSHYFCDNCGTHVTHAKDASPPKFCLHCIGTSGGAHLNDESLEFLVGKIEHYNGCEEKSEGNLKAMGLKILLARLFIEKVTIFEDNIHRLPDGPNKDRQCKTILEKLTEIANRIHHLMDPPEEE